MFRVDSKAARQVWTYAGVLIFLVAIYMIRKTLFVFGVALMFAYLLYPLVNGIDRRLRLKTNLFALILPFSLVFFVLFVFMWFIKEPASRDAKQFFEFIQLSRLSGWTPLGLPIGQQLVDHVSDLLKLVANFGVGRALGHAASDLIDILVVPILTFLLLKDGRLVLDSLIESLGIEQVSESLLRDAHVLLLEYMRAVLILSFATLISYSIGLTLLRVRYAMLLAFAAFLLEFIPLMGPFAAAAAILSTAWFTGASTGHLLLLASFLLGYRVCQDYILSPQLMRRGVQLHPLIVIFGVFAGGDIGGVAGILVSVPILALVRLIWYQTRKGHKHYGHSLEAVTA